MSTLQSLVRLAEVAFSVGALATAVGSAGCAAPLAVEKEGSVTSKDLAPLPMLCAKSSAETLADQNIAKWCLYRGKGGVYLTGYSKTGRALKGLSTEFARAANGGVRNLRLKVNDGSKLAVFHSAGSDHITTTSALTAGSQNLVNAATRDLGLLRAAIRQKERIGATLTPANNCASNMLGTLLDSFVGAGGMSQTAALSLLGQLGAFANASGSACIGFNANGTSGSVGLPFGGNIASIDPTTACANDPDPATCQADFGGFGAIGKSGGFSFLPNPGAPGSSSIPTLPVNLGGGPSGSPDGSLGASGGGGGTGPDGSFNPVGDSKAGLPTSTGKDPSSTGQPPSTGNAPSDNGGKEQGNSSDGQPPSTGNAPSDNGGKEQGNSSDGQPPSTGNSPSDNGGKEQGNSSDGQQPSSGNAPGDNGGKEQGGFADGEPPSSGPSPSDNGGKDQSGSFPDTSANPNDGSASFSSGGGDGPESGGGGGDGSED